MEIFPSLIWLWTGSNITFDSPVSQSVSQPASQPMHCNQGLLCPLSFPLRVQFWRTSSVNSFNVDKREEGGVRLEVGRFSDTLWSSFQYDQPESWHNYDILFAPTDGKSWEKELRFHGIWIDPPLPYLLKRGCIRRRQTTELSNADPRGTHHGKGLILIVLGNFYHFIV